MQRHRSASVALCQIAHFHAKNQVLGVRNAVLEDERMLDTQEVKNAALRGLRLLRNRLRSLVVQPRNPRGNSVQES